MVAEIREFYWDLKLKWFQQNSGGLKRWKMGEG